MTTSSNTPEEKQPRDATYWAQVATFKVTQVPTGALNLNVEGRQGLSPLHGFGQMWQKIYRIRLKGATATPIEVIKAWKENFSSYWPKKNRFYAPLTGIAPGEVGLINMSIPGNIPLSTGVLVLYADEESFTFMTPPGHVFAGWITFSAYEEDGTTIAQVSMLIRAFDPVYEFGFRFLGASKQEDKFWQQTLAALAAQFGVSEPVETQITCIDPKMQWSRFWNVWLNSAIRTTIYKVSAPVRWVSRGGRRRG
jgi:hypothetical protein